jgi:hypothetical protein
MVLNTELFDKMAEALITDYTRVYRVNTKTNAYQELEEKYQLLIEKTKT